MDPDDARRTSSGSTRSSRTRTGRRRTRTCSSGTAGRGCIDHGAALYIHHTWRDPDDARAAAVRADRATTCCCRIAGSMADADARLAPRIDRPGSSATLVARRSRTPGCPDDPLAGDAAAQRRRLRRDTSRAGSSAAASVRRGGGACPRRRVSSSSTRSSASCPRVERGEQPQRRDRPALPAAALPRGADRARRGAARGARARISTRRSMRPHLDAIERIAAGDPTAGPIARLEPGRAVPLAGLAGEHDHPAVARSTPGCATTRRRELDHLVATLVR